MSPILAVAIDAPLRRLFDYHAPPGPGHESLVPGMRLWVPFGRRRAVGVLVERRTRSTLPAARLRSAIVAIDAAPTFDRELFDLLVWSADYYRHPIGEVIAAALPAPLRAGAEVEATAVRWALSAAARTGGLPALNARAFRLRELLAVLEAGHDAGEAELAALSPRWREHLRELERRGWVVRLQRARETLQRATPHVAPGPELSAPQLAAVTAIGAATGTFRQFLLHGVTGSGKTEVYLRAIERVVERGRQALVLVPEIALTPQLVARFAQRFHAPLAVLHSSRSDQERLEAWRSARSGEAPVVIGTRSAVFAPLSRPGLIVVDEEHDPSYKQQEGFRYSARDLALIRGQRLSVPVVLGSATPSLESLERVRAGRAELLTLPDRAAGAAPPTMTLIDLRRHATTQGIATPSVLAIGRHLERGGQVLLFLNRRGYAPALFCTACGWTAACARCDARLTVHQRERRLLCHHCGAERGIPLACQDCDQPVKPVGQGTERIEETLGQLFPDVPLERIDRDAIRRRGALEDALARITSGEARLLVGTQMLAKGHHFPGVTLVVILNADQGLFGVDFRAAERLAQTIVQVSGRAGRAEQPGEVLIQTEYPEHPLLAGLVAGGYEAFANAALEERRAARWPPFTRLAVLRAEAARREATLAFLARAREHALAAASPVEVLGPAAAPMERRAGHHRAQLLLRATSHADLQRLLAAWVPQVESLVEAKKVRWSIDVDPAELF
jgi:primosomal protein N' (replication factor Y)